MKEISLGKENCSQHGGNRDQDLSLHLPQEDKKPSF